MILSKSGISYRRFGVGTPLLLLHGIPGSSAVWEETSALLCKEFDVLLPDLIGFGGSRPSMDLRELHAEGQASALIDLLDELAIVSVAIAAHDFGGPVAIAMHAKRPELVSHLALYSSNAFADTPIPFPLSLVVFPLIGPLVSRLLFSRASLHVMLKFGQGRPRGPVNGKNLGDDNQVRSTRLIFSESLTRLAELYGPIERHLGNIASPRTVGWGTSDPFFPIQQGERTAHAMRASFTRFPGAGHFLPEERPREIAADIAALVGRRNDAPH